MPTKARSKAEQQAEKKPKSEKKKAEKKKVDEAADETTRPNREDQGEVIEEELVEATSQAEEKGSEEHDECEDSIVSGMSNLDVKDAEYEESDAEDEDDDADALRVSIKSTVTANVPKKADRKEIYKKLDELNDDEVFLLAAFLQLPPDHVKPYSQSKNLSPDPITQFNAINPSEEEIAAFADTLHPETISYDNVRNFSIMFKTLIENVTHGSVSFQVLTCMTIEGRAQHSGLKKQVPRFFMESRLTAFFEDYVKDTMAELQETLQSRSPQEFFEINSEGLGSIQLPKTFLEPKNRTKWVRCLIPIDPKVSYLLRKIHGAMVESYEPSSEVIYHMRLVQSQQQLLCKMLKMLLKALEARPDAFSWAGKAIQKIEDLEGGRTTDERAVPTLLELWAQSQGINLWLGSAAFEIFITSIPRLLTEADFKSLSDLFGATTYVADGFEKIYKDAEAKARNATAAFSSVPIAGEMIKSLLPLKFMAGVRQSMKIAGQEGNMVGPLQDWTRFEQAVSGDSPITWEKIGVQGRKGNGGALRPVDLTTGNYGSGAMVLAAEGKSSPKQEKVNSKPAVSVKIVPPARQQANPQGAKKNVVSTQPSRSSSQQKAQTSQPKATMTGPRELVRAEMPIDEARQISMKFFKELQVLEKICAVYGNSTNQAVYFKLLRGKDGNSSLVFVPEDVMKDATPREKKAIFTLKEASRKFHKIPTRQGPKARVNYGAAEEDDFELDFIEVDENENTEDDFAEDAEDMEELLPPPDVQRERRVWSTPTPSQDIRSQGQGRKFYDDQRHSAEDFQDYRTQACEAREELLKMKRQVQLQEQRLRFNEEEAAVFSARMNVDPDREFSRNGPRRTPWAGGNSWLSQPMDASFEPGWDPDMEQSSGRRRMVGQGDDAASSQSDH